MIRKKISKSCFVDFQLTLTLKKCRILHIENLTSNKNLSVIKLFMNIALVDSMFPTILKYGIKNG